MGVGKYSPLVHDCGPFDYTRYGCAVDAHGYDEYGYHIETERDCAGYTEDDYLIASTDGHDLEEAVLQGCRAPGFENGPVGNETNRNSQVVNELQALYEADDLPEHYKGIVYRALEFAKQAK